MKTIRILLLPALLAAPAAFGEIQTDWAFHAAGDGSRLTQPVPGETFPFLANGTDQVADAEPVTLYVLTPHDFAGEMDEQIFVRWWDGVMAHWIMGTWVKNITLDATSPGRQLRGLPREGTQALDLWRIEIPAEITQPGMNFYAIQLKGFSQTATAERYLLQQLGGDFSRTNNLGQVWSASEEFDGQDWGIQILP